MRADASGVLAVLCELCRCVLLFAAVWSWSELSCLQLIFAQHAELLVTVSIAFSCPTWVEKQLHIFCFVLKGDPIEANTYLRVEREVIAATFFNVEIQVPRPPLNFVSRNIKKKAKLGDWSANLVKVVKAEVEPLRLASGPHT